jgi:MurNAc alpha-1-phosphate uridylyltransferase
MLLAAGLGTRLRPMTETIPKPLVPVAGVPLIERIIANARAEGAKGFVANAHYRADQVLAHFGGLLKVSREDELLGTGGGVKRALPMLHSDPFFVMNTDAFWPAGSDKPLKRMIARYAGPQDIVMLCAPAALPAATISASRPMARLRATMARRSSMAACCSSAATSLPIPPMAPSRSIR